MGIRSVRIAGFAALMACAWAEASHAAFVTGPTYPPTPPGDYFVYLEGASYSDPMMISGFFDIDPSLPGLVNPDITIAGFVGTFSDITRQEADPVIANAWDVTIDDPAGPYYFNLVLDDWSSLLAGQDGATIDSSSDVTSNPGGGSVLASDMTGDLEVPAPAALPVFMSALAGLGWFRRRKQA
jgi:hypothetical protein